MRMAVMYIAQDKDGKDLQEFADEGSCRAFELEQYLAMEISQVALGSGVNPKQMAYVLRKISEDTPARLGNITIALERHKLWIRENRNGD